MTLEIELGITGGEETVLTTQTSTVQNYILSLMSCICLREPQK
jgi:fructose/tagatose bisphosphate aldolase